MLNSLHLEGVGPAEKLAVEFKPRLNFLTGDNGLGKSFVLDIAWWSLTRTWARGVMATARSDAQKSASTMRPIDGRSSKAAQPFLGW